MRTSNKSYFNNAVAVLLLFYISSVSCLAFGRDVILSGRVMYSFSDRYVLLQGKELSYKINISLLSKNARSVIKRGLYSQGEVKLVVPKSALEFAWPNSNREQNEKYYADLKKFHNLLREESFEHLGQLVLKGKLLFSFSEAYFLVQANDTVYRIKRSLLSEAQKNIFNKSALGEYIQLSLSRDAVEYAWSNRQQQMATNQLQIFDHISSDGRNLLIKGKVLYSFSEPLLLVESGGTIYQINKSAVSSNAIEKLETPTSHVEITTPIKDIEFVWSKNPILALDQRLETTKRKP